MSECKCTGHFHEKGCSAMITNMITPKPEASKVDESDYCDDCHLYHKGPCEFDVDGITPLVTPSAPAEAAREGIFLNTKEFIERLEVKRPDLALIYYKKSALATEQRLERVMLHLAQKDCEKNSN